MAIERVCSKHRLVLIWRSVISDVHLEFVRLKINATYLHVVLWKIDFYDSSGASSGVLQWKNTRYTDVQSERARKFSKFTWKRLGDAIRWQDWVSTVRLLSLL